MILLILFEMFKLRLILRRHFLQKGAQRAPKNDFFLLCTATIIAPFRLDFGRIRESRRIVIQPWKDDILNGVIIAAVLNKKIAFEGSHLQN